MHATGLLAFSQAVSPEAADRHFHLGHNCGTLSTVNEDLKHRPSHSGFTPPDRLRPFLNEWGMVEFAAANVRVAPGDWLEMLVGGEWLPGRLKVYPNPDGPHLEVATDQHHRIGDDAKLRTRVDGPSAPVQLLIPRPQFVHPRCSVIGIRFMLDGRLLKDNEPVEVDVEGQWREGPIRLPLHHEQALLCDMVEQLLAFITCQTRVRRRR